MKTEDIIRLEAEWKAMRVALGTHLLVIEFASAVMAAEARLAAHPSPPLPRLASEQPERPSSNTPCGT